MLCTVFKFCAQLQFRHWVNKSAPLYYLLVSAKSKLSSLILWPILLDSTFDSVSSRLFLKRFIVANIQLGILQVVLCIVFGKFFNVSNLYNVLYVRKSWVYSKLINEAWNCNTHTLHIRSKQKSRLRKKKVFI